MGGSVVPNDDQGFRVMLTQLFQKSDSRFSGTGVCHRHGFDFTAFEANRRVVGCSGPLELDTLHSEG